MDRIKEFRTTISNSSSKPLLSLRRTLPWEDRPRCPSTVWIRTCRSDTWGACPCSSSNRTNNTSSSSSNSPTTTLVKVRTMTLPTNLRTTVGSVAILACKDQTFPSRTTRLTWRSTDLFTVLEYTTSTAVTQCMWRHCTMIMFELFMREAHLKKKIDDERDQLLSTIH
jgi:hypothetical protein